MRISKFFNLNRNQPSLDFVDVDYSKDTPVFIDPYALKVLPSPWANECVALVQDFFETVLEKIKAGKITEAEALLTFLGEPNETHLGLSKGKSRGRAIGLKKAQKICESIGRSEAVKTGLLRDLEETILMIDGISSDIISDITTNIIRYPLIKYTQQIAELYGIPLTQDVESGPFWNPREKSWQSNYVSLPMTPFGKLILAPKAIVRRVLEYSIEEYFNHYILEELKSREISANSQLVKLLKDGTKTVSKKDLIEKYGSHKSLIVSETLRNPEVLERYRKYKSSSQANLLSHEEMALGDDSELPDWDNLFSDVKCIEAGRDDAYSYEQAIEALLSALFYPSLAFPRKQKSIHGGRKRIDIEYTNSAQSGFFNWLGRHYPSAFIFIECKNFSGDLGNTELDQMSGRFSPSRGMFGIIICRSFADKKLFMERCKDTTKDQRGYIIILDDDDLEKLVVYRKNIGFLTEQQFPLLRERFEELVH